MPSSMFAAASGKVALELRESVGNTRAVCLSTGILWDADTGARQPRPRPGRPARPYPGGCLVASIPPDAQAPPPRAPSRAVAPAATPSRGPRCPGPRRRPPQLLPLRNNPDYVARCTHRSPQARRSRCSTVRKSDLRNNRGFSRCYTQKRGCISRRLVRRQVGDCWITHLPRHGANRVSLRAQDAVEREDCHRQALADVYLGRVVHHNHRRVIDVNLPGVRRGVASDPKRIGDATHSGDQEKGREGARGLI